MSALPVLIGWLVLAAGPADHAAPTGYVPAGTAAELHALGRLALLRDPRAKLVGFSDRDPLGVRDGRAVLAETSGPGIVQRIWIAEPKAGLPSAARLRVHLDGRAEPVLDAALHELFSGKHPHFPGVVNGARPGGYVLYTPLPFRDGCRVTLEGMAAPEYAVSLWKLPSPEGVASFHAVPDASEAFALQLAHTLALEPGALFSNEPSYSRQRLVRALSIRPQSEDAEYAVDGNDRSTWVFALPAGPRTIRSFDAIVDPKTLDAWRSARLRIVWEGDRPEDAAVDIRLSEFFGLPERGLTYRSTLMAENQNVWSNRFPMPYERGGIVVIDAEGPIKGALRVRTVRSRAAGAGYLRATTATGGAGTVAWETRTGRGHLAGIFLTLSGRGERAPGLAQGVFLLADDRPLYPRGEPLLEAFDAAWPDVKGRLDGAQTYPLSGVPLYRQEGDRWDLAAYRWRLTDPVPFERALALRTGPDHAAGATPPDDVRATVFWYSERPGPVRTRATRP